MSPQGARGAESALVEIDGLHYSKKLKGKGKCKGKGKSKGTGNNKGHVTRSMTPESPFNNYGKKG